MPLNLPQSQVRSSENIGLNAMMAYLIGGVALVLASLWWFFPEALQKRDPIVGRLEARYRAEVGNLLSSAGVAHDASRCSYYANSLVLACEVSPTAKAGLRSALQQAGWLVAAGKPDQLVFTRERDTASLICESPTRTGLCQFKLSYRLNNADA